jgi:hypothetical protein
MKPRKPFILNFGTKVYSEDADFSLVEYSYSQNLNVFKDTDLPAIGIASMDTETLTKTSFEASDSDKDFNVRRVLDTPTGTPEYEEASNFEKNAKVKRLLDTYTETRNFGEVADSDLDRSTTLFNILSLLDTETLTERGTEVTDADHDL